MPTTQRTGTRARRRMWFRPKYRLRAYRSVGSGVVRTRAGGEIESRQIEWPLHGRHSGRDEMLRYPRSPLSPQDKQVGVDREIIMTIWSTLPSTFQSCVYHRYMSSALHVQLLIRG